MALYSHLYVVLHYIFVKHCSLDNVSDIQSRPQWQRVEQTNIPPPPFTLEQSIQHMEMPAIKCVCVCVESARLLCIVPFLRFVFHKSSVVSELLPIKMLRIVRVWTSGFCLVHYIVNKKNGRPVVRYAHRVFCTGRKGKTFDFKPPKSDGNDCLKRRVMEKL